MLEFLLCSLVTIFPDYLFRRYAQGKRWGSEITWFSMWYELRWGITACVVLTVALITVIFYYHPSTTDAGPFFRTITILPEDGGRVEEVFVDNNAEVEAGAPLFRLEDSRQRTALETARQEVAEVEAGMQVADSELASASGLVEQAQGNYEQAEEELDTREQLRQRDPGIVPEREIERSTILVAARLGALNSARANRDAVAARIETLLPARMIRAEAALRQAEVELEKTVIRAGVDGRVEQFVLQPGDYVNPILRPAGILVPLESLESGREAVQAGFNQITSQVIHPGMVAEISCISKPFTVVPMVVTGVQDVIAAGQLRPTDQLVDVLDRARPGTLTVRMEPLYPGQLEGVPPGSKCIANAYTNFHDELAEGEHGLWAGLFMHMVDTVGIVHAVILRIQTLMLPVRTLVFAGH